MNLIKSIRQFIADIKQAINDPYLCLNDEDKRMWQEIERELAEKAQK